MGRQLPAATRGDLDELDLHQRLFQKAGEVSYLTLPWVGTFDAWWSQKVRESNLKILKISKISKN